MSGTTLRGHSRSQCERLDSSPLVTSAGGTDFQDYYDAQEMASRRVPTGIPRTPPIMAMPSVYIPENGMESELRPAASCRTARLPGRSLLRLLRTGNPRSVVRG